MCLIVIIVVLIAVFGGPQNGEPASVLYQYCVGILVAGMAAGVLQMLVYARRHGGWARGCAVLQAENEAKEARELARKWKAYRDDCARYTPEERYWRRFRQRQVYYAIGKWARKR
jgi:hypothetical protein